VWETQGTGPASVFMYVKVHSSLMMQAVRTSETSVDNHFTRQYIPEVNSEHYTRRRENLKSHICESCSDIFQSPCGASWNRCWLRALQTRGMFSLTAGRNSPPSATTAQRETISFGLVTLWHVWELKELHFVLVCIFKGPLFMRSEINIHVQLMRSLTEFY
jgi:hypothetical protein